MIRTQTPRASREDQGRAQGTDTSTNQGRPGRSRFPRMASEVGSPAVVLNLRSLEQHDSVCYVSPGMGHGATATLGSNTQGMCTALGGAGGCTQARGRTRIKVWNRGGCAQTTALPQDSDPGQGSENRWPLRAPLAGVLPGLQQMRPGARRGPTCS